MDSAQGNKLQIVWKLRTPITALGHQGTQEFLAANGQSQNGSIVAFLTSFALFVLKNKFHQMFALTLEKANCLLTDFLVQYNAITIPPLIIRSIEIIQK